MEKVVHKILFAIVCLASLLSFIEAQIFSSSQGNCLKNGTILWNGEGTPSPYHDASYSCRSNYGRPFGVCNCIYNPSCAQLLAGCTPGATNVSFSPAIPSVIYVGRYYEFRAGLNNGDMCTYRSLPAGLNATLNSSGLIVSGTPTESVPMSTYGFASSSTVAFVTFEVQSCPDEEGISIPPQPTTEPTPFPPPNSPSLGNCLRNGSIVWEGPGTPTPFNTPEYQCVSGYGRPRGVCSCQAINSCAQRLAGCYGAGGSLSFSPPIPSVLYVGRYYQFSAEIPLTTHCFLRPLPAGLSISYGFFDNFSYKIFISGIPIESMPMADYAIGVEMSAYGMHAFFSFEVQACGEEDVIVNPTCPPIPSLSPTNIPTPSPSSSPSTCSLQGSMRCVGTSQYQTCNRGAWDPVQSCQTGLVCSPSGDFVYCI